MRRVSIFFVGAWIASFATGKPVKHSKEDKLDQLSTMQVWPPKFPTPPPEIRFSMPEIELPNNRNSSYSAGAKVDRILTTLVVFIIMGTCRCAMCCFCKSDKVSRKGFVSAASPAVSSFGQASSAPAIRHHTFYISYSSAAVTSQQPPIILKCGNSSGRSGVTLQTAPAVSSFGQASSAPSICHQPFCIPYSYAAVTSQQPPIILKCGDSISGRSGDILQPAPALTSLSPIDIPCCYHIVVMPDSSAAETPNVLSGQDYPGYNEDSPPKTMTTSTIDIDRPPEYSTVISATQENSFPEVRHAAPIRIFYMRSLRNTTKSWLDISSCH